MPKTKETPLMNNADVKELLSILRDNGRDTKSLLDMLSSVASMEQQLKAATDGLAVMQNELATMRDERNHPVRTLLQNTTRTLSKLITGIRNRVKAIKNKIIGGCKNAVDAFKATGVTALNNLAEYFDVKSSLLAERESINFCIDKAQASIEKIEKVSEEYHSAGRHIRNIGRAIQGKEPITEIKPNGKLAALIQAPYRSEIKSLNFSLRGVNRTLAALDRLEKAAVKNKEQDRPSTLETMKRLQVEIKAKEPAVPSNTKKKEAEL